MGKKRKSGYYWIHWSYGNGLGDVWRVGFYMESSDNWVLPGDARIFKDGDFIAVNENGIDGILSRHRVVNFVFYIALFEMAWNAGYIVYHFIEYVYRLTK